MPELIDALPGISLPVEEVTQRLDSMWAGGDASERSPSEFRASQMNVVLHLGKEVKASDARVRFDGLIRFAQRYPSRIIVLCPRDSGSDQMTAKLFSQCYIGSSHREMCCCEALLLSYQPEGSGFLSNQVSTWLESDLPTYHWFSGVPSHRISGYFTNLLAGVRRCVYDSSIEPEDVSSLDWPQPQRVYDLAKARILPVRQSIGQYLSGYNQEMLCAGLKTITIRYVASLRGEAEALREWVTVCLRACFDRPDAGHEFPSIHLARSEPMEDPACLSMMWDYANENSFYWSMDQAELRGQIKSRFVGREEQILTQISLLPLEKALAEALFF